MFTIDTSRGDWIFCLQWCTLSAEGLSTIITSYICWSSVTLYSSYQVETMCDQVFGKVRFLLIHAYFSLSLFIYLYKYGRCFTSWPLNEVERKRALPYNGRKLCPQFQMTTIFWILISPTNFLYYFRTHNLWLRCALLLENLSSENSLDLMKPKQSSGTAYVPDNISSEQQEVF